MTPRLSLALAAIVLALAVQADSGSERPVAREHASQPPAPQRQTSAEAHAKSAGCMSCHTATDRHTMHQNPAVVLGCTELPLILSDHNSALPTLDSTRLLARAALKRAVGKKAFAA